MKTPTEQTRRNAVWLRMRHRTVWLPHFLHHKPKDKKCDSLKTQFIYSSYLRFLPFVLGPLLCFPSELQTVGRTPRTGNQPRRIAAYTGQHKQKKRGQTSMPWVGFKPTIPVFGRAKTVHALVSAATVIGGCCLRSRKYMTIHVCTASAHSLAWAGRIAGQVSSITSRLRCTEVFPASSCIYIPFFLLSGYSVLHLMIWFLCTGKRLSLCFLISCSHFIHLYFTI
jgi:hypothetical protein